MTRYGTLSYSCPSGWSRSGSSCYRNVTTTVTRYGTLSYSCPSGWSRSGSSCYRFVSTTFDALRHTELFLSTGLVAFWEHVQPDDYERALCVACVFAVVQ